MALTDIPTVIVELGFAETSADYLILNSATSGILNTNKLAAGTGAVPVWTDVSPYVTGFGTRRGRQRQIDRFTAGTATVTFNNTTGRFSPSNLSGPYVAGGVTQVRPGIAIRIRAIWSGTTYPIYYGYIESWAETVNVDAPKAMFSTITASDGFARIAHFDGVAQGAIGAGELAGARIRRVLDNAGWDAGLRDLDDGQTTLQATTLEGNALSELQLVADSENGAIYMSADGLFTFDARYARLLETRSATSQATFGDLSPELPYSSYVPVHDNALLINRAQYTRVGGGTQIADDVLSQADYGIVTDTRDNLLNQSDGEVLGAAGWVVARFAYPEERIDQIGLSPRRAPTTLWPQALGRLIRDRITVKRRPAAGDTMTKAEFIEGIAHTYDVSSGTWITQFQLSSASAFTAFFILDSATQGVLNTNQLAY